MGKKSCDFLCPEELLVQVGSTKTIRLVVSRGSDDKRFVVPKALNLHGPQGSYVLRICSQTGRSWNSQERPRDSIFRLRLFLLLLLLVAGKKPRHLVGELVSCSPNHCLLMNGLPLNAVAFESSGKKDRAAEADLLHGMSHSTKTRHNWQALI